MPAKKTSKPHSYHHGDLRKAILDTALALTTESGVQSLSLREIARRLGVTPAAPYHHFKDRQTLLLELAIDGYTALLAAMQRAPAAAPPGSDEVLAYAQAYLAFGRSHAALYAIMLSGQLATHPRAPEMLTIADASLELVRASVVRSTGLGPAASTEAVFCLWSLLHGILMLDDNNVLRETAAEQDRLALQGAMGIVKGFVEMHAPQPAPKQTRRATRKA